MFCQIPLKTVVNGSQIFPDFFLAKSGIKFTNGAGKSRLVSGFGFSKNKVQAINSSKFEALEHFYATYDFNQNYINKNKFFGGVALNNSVKRVFLPSEVVLGPVPAEIGKNADANGLGCHAFYEKAVEHGILELVERHLLAQIWYGSMFVTEVPEAHLTVSNFYIRIFTPNAPSVPMAIAIIDDLQEGIWALGSAARLHMESAIEHAIQEAMMLVESASIEKGFSYSAEIEQRILSLRSGKLSKLREEFFTSKIKEREKGFSSKSMGLEEIVHVSLGDSSDIWVVHLLKSEKLHVIRALCPIAQNPRWLRGGNLAVPEDPFC